MKMAMASIMCFTLFLPSLFSKGFSTTSNKVDLIEQVCKPTIDPNLCVSSLRSNPKSSSADIKGLAHIMLEVSMAKAKDNLAQVNKLFSQATDKVIKDCLDICKTEYGMAISTWIPQAFTNLESGSLDDAISGIDWAAECAEDCEDSFGDGIHVRPSPLTDRNNVFVRLTRIGEHIIVLLQK